MNVHSCNAQYHHHVNVQRGIGIKLGVYLQGKL